MRLLQVTTMFQEGQTTITNERKHLLDDGFCDWWMRNHLRMSASDARVQWVAPITFGNLPISISNQVPFYSQFADHRCMRTVWERHRRERGLIAAKTGGMVLLGSMGLSNAQISAISCSDASIELECQLRNCGSNAGGDDVGDRHDSWAIHQDLEKISVLLSWSQVCYCQGFDDCQSFCLNSRLVTSDLSHCKSVRRLMLRPGVRFSRTFTSKMTNADLCVEMSVRPLFMVSARLINEGHWPHKDIWSSS